MKIITQSLGINVKSSYLWFILKDTDMRNLNTMNGQEKRNHLSKLMGKINANTKYVVEDVTPKGYGPAEKK